MKGRLTLKYLPAIKAAVSRLCNTVVINYDRKELEAEAIYASLVAEDRFNKEEPDTKFWSFVKKRVKSAIIDYNSDLYPQQRKQLRKITTFIKTNGIEKASVAEIHDATGLSISIIEGLLPYAGVSDLITAKRKEENLAEEYIEEDITQDIYDKVVYELALSEDIKYEVFKASVLLDQSNSQIIKKFKIKESLITTYIREVSSELKTKLEMKYNIDKTDLGG